MSHDNHPVLDEAAVSDQIILLHVSLLFGWVIPIPFIGIIAPLIIWQTTKKDNPIIDQHGRNAMNWVISSTIYSAILPLTVIGIALLPILAGLGVVFPIIAAVQAGKGRVWSYPLSIDILGGNPETVLRRTAIALLSLCILPLTAVVGSSVWMQRHSQWINRLSHGNGTVTEILEETDTDGDRRYKPVVSFKDESGETYQISPFWNSNPPDYAEGESVKVLYPADEPQRGLINVWWEKWLFPTMALILASIFLVFAAIPSLVCFIISWFA